MPVLTFSEYQRFAERYPLVDSKAAANVLWVFDRDERYGRRPVGNVTEGLILLCGHLHRSMIPMSLPIGQAVAAYRDEEPNAVLWLREKAAAQ